MTTETAATSATTTKDERSSSTGGDPLGTARQAIGSAAGTVQNLATDAADRVPDMVATTKDVLAGADRQLRTGSDAMLTVGAAMSFGLAIGLLLGGSPRLLVGAALIPAGVMALDLYDRASGPGTARRVQGA